MDTAYLVLENGSVFEGQAFGFMGETLGELVFTTGMSGFLETLTDPANYGQIVLQTFPLVGSYGVIPSDFESEEVQVKAYIVREWCQEPSNFRSEGSLDIFLREKKIPGLCGIDTRALTREIRSHGVMNAMISRKKDLTADEMARLKAHKITGAVEATSVKEPSTAKNGNAVQKVALWDFGAPAKIRQELLKRSCEVITVPYSYTAEQIAALAPDGVVLGDGPGNPADNADIIAEIKAFAQKKIPTLGIGLGHQMLAISQGAKTQALPHGHRGSNHPVCEEKTGRLFVTAQNHGYVVSGESIADAEMSYINQNDGTCEGIAYKSIPAISVQFHPAAHIGINAPESPYDTFVNMMGRES